jgi:hypothetical protein
MICDLADNCSGLFADGSVVPPTEAVATTLSIARLGADGVRLSWPGNDKNCSYSVFRSSEPYAGFAVYDEGPFSAGVDEVFTYDDLNSGVGNVTINHFYRMTSYDCGAGTSARSNVVGEFDFAIIPGN